MAPKYRVVVNDEYHGALDTARLLDALRMLLARHQFLRAAAVLCGSGRIADRLPRLSAPSRATGASHAGDETLTSLWRRSVRAHAGRVAVSAPDGDWTYAELDAAAEGVARRLVARGAVAEELIGIALPPGRLQVAAMLGVLKAGAAYVPLDLSDPRERQEFVVRDAGLSLVVAEHDPGLPGLAVVPPAGDLAPGDPVEDRVTPRMLCYVLYTSGSTGRPNGVQVEHRNVVRLVAAGRAELGTAPSDVWSLLHSAAFDFSVWELWGALSSGARVAVAPAGLAAAPEDLVSFLAREQVTVVSLTPTVLHQILTARPDAPGHPARLVVLGGEDLAKIDLRRWFEVPRPELVNMYGITETTVHVTVHRVRPEDADANGVSHVVGRPLPGWTVTVEAAPGEWGELVVGGDGVTRGYHSRPGLTAGRFIPGPNGRRRYRSGDLARLRPDGLLEYGGRADDQIKVRGVRIEPAEVEAAVRRSPQVTDCAVVLVRFAAGDDRLVCYVVPRGDEVDEARLRREVADLLPAVMVPAAFRPVDALPVTSSGKRDRRRLVAAAPEEREGAVELPARDSPVRDEAAEVVLRLWSQLLERDEIPLDVPFFELGGNSLLMFPMLTGLRRHGCPDLAMMDLFEHPTARLLVDLVRRVRAGSPVPAVSGSIGTAQAGREALARRRRLRTGR